MKHLNIHIQSYGQDGEIILGEIKKILNQNDRIALIGTNGVGKSTFMKILSGQITEYEGHKENIGNMSLGYLEQIHFNDGMKKIREELKDAFGEIRDIEKKIKKEEEYMEENIEYEKYEKYTQYLDLYNTLGGYTYENEVERVSRGIGIFHLLEKTISDVSGGERTKIALAKILLSKPDFLLLDEPTNFIDLISLEWLEKYLLETWKGGYLIVSHDREFLDETCTSVIEMLGKDGIQEYAGSYSSSVQEKKKQNIQASKKYDEQQQHIATEKKLIERFRAGSRAGWAKSRGRALEKIALLEKPFQKKEITFSFPYDKKGPENLIKIENAFIGRKEPLFYIREAHISRNERVGIIGENGVGKSTFLKTLLQQVSPLDGILNIHENAQILYFSQMHETLEEEKTILENFPLHGLPLNREKIGGLIEQYGFSYMDALKKVKHLSGGERSRLLFALLSHNIYAWQRIKKLPFDTPENSRHPEILSDSNILILDEPTNHLDSNTREALEKSLGEYPGAVLFISHDRYFINKLAQKLWIIQDGELILSYGNYDDYQFKKERGLDFDMSLFNLEGEMNLVLEEKLGSVEARRIKEKFSQKKARRNK